VREGFIGGAFTSCAGTASTQRTVAAVAKLAAPPFLRRRWIHQARVDYFTPTKAAKAARALAPHCLMLDEFIAREAADGRITPDCFTDHARMIHLHGHCHQKALASVEPTVRMLSVPRNYTVKTIPSGCCGMAGSFGYEAEHYEVSMKVGELVLLPAVRQIPVEDLIAAPGTSCRHQVHDGTGRHARHPAEILREAVGG
jgi:Fe-S oxidoreductase